MNFTVPNEVERSLRSAMEAVPRIVSDPRDRRDVVLAMLFCQHTLDEFDDAQSVTTRRHISGASRTGAGGALPRILEDQALTVLDANGAQGFRVPLIAQLLRRAAAVVGRMDDAAQDRLIEAFRGVRFDFAALAYPEMLGDATESFLKETEASMRYSGEHYTPRELVHLLTEIAQPQAGMRIYDPFCGTGGMLLHAKQYVDEQGEAASQPTLVGQDINTSTAELASLNLYFHRIQHAAVEHGDSLLPPPPPSSEFDLVLSVPPFGLSLQADQAQALGQHALYGPVSERGPADWAFLQYMLGLVSRRGGTVCTVVTHGPLFRGGRDQATRSALLDADVVEAVIGLAPNLFSSTAIEPCVLLLRAPGQKTAERRGKVLFIDASREYERGLAQNLMRSEHIEKIASAVRGFEDVHRFARVVDRSYLSENDDSLNIRRYVDSAPLLEPQDIQAHMGGGMPVAEINGKEMLLGAYGITPRQLFTARYGDPDYMDFLPPSERPDARMLTELARDSEQRLLAAFGEWWELTERDIAGLAPAQGRSETSASRMGHLRIELLRGYGELMGAPGILAPHALSGAFTDWWREVRPHLMTLAQRGCLLPSVEDLSALREGLASRIDALVAARRSELVETYERWQEKYGLSFREIESQLTGPSAGFLQNNPWSQQSAWDLSSLSGADVAARRRQTAQRVHALTDTEKTVEGALGKLDVDELMILLPVLDAASEAEGRVDRCTLGDVVKAARTGTSGRLSEEPSGVPAVEARHLTERGFVAAGIRYRRVDSPPSPSEMLTAGDVLLTARVMAARGYRAIVWNEQLPSATYSASVVRLTPDTTHLLPGYLAAWLSHRSVHPRLYAQARESRDALYDLPAGRLLNVEIELPSLQAQQRIVDAVAALAEQRELRHAQLAKIDLIKRAMMKELESDRTSIGLAR
ncbi:N-6 DNA methylase [Streptomyces sp. FB2]|uniref:N-6 DNA methylase n=1 Tax=Streptomyces sp. FB2 TaxID=2902454 RepID=UPI001F413E18|nr:N-6 DNA methylase [Streptomyces sp. FB2]MCF2538158.1 N-6 DNA methylase [Streptomyces sp. FB2]